LRFPRVVIPDWPHHVVQRGNRKSDVFGDDSDRLVYLRLLRNACDKHGTLVWEYTLMANHVHHLMVPSRKDSLAKTIKEAHAEYSRYLNTKYGLVGHAWQGRFNSVPMDWDHYVNAVRYVLRNPVRAGIVERAEDYLWSSAAARCGLRDDPLIAKDHPLVREITNWRDWLRIEDPKADERIRRHTQTGRPLGSEEFVRNLELQIGRRLLPRKRGRRPLKDAEQRSTTDKDQPLKVRSLFG
jgi:REP-associated tyrosine transposase